MIRIFKDKTLLVVSSIFPDKTNNFYGGIFVKEQLKYLKDYFKKVIVISPTPRTFGIYNSDKLCKDYEFDNVKVYFPRFWHAPISYFRKRLGERQFKVVDKVIKKEKIKFDLIHAHFTYPSGYVGAKLKEKYRKPLVVTAHGGDIYKLPFVSKYWKNKVLRILEKADKVITVSKRNANCIATLGSKSIVIPNGFDQKLFFPQDKTKYKNRLNLSLDKKIILTVGNLVEIKGQKYLIEAMEEIIKKRKDVLCLIIGSGNLKTRLENQIKELGLKKFVKLIGGKPHNKIAFWMNACDLFVLPSLSEGNPTVMFECLGCGKPFIGTKVGGIPEIIVSDDYGLLCEPANPEDLAEKILIGLDKNWDKNKILNYSKKFMWSKIAKEIIDVYKGVLR